MKRIITYFFSILILLSVSITARGAERSDLQRVYEKLNQYFYLPYYSESLHYDEYLRQMEESKRLLADKNASDEEIDTQYENLKAAYTKVTLDTFDYSLLTLLMEDYEKLSFELFTADTIQPLSDSATKIYKELEAPTLFKHGNRTKVQFEKDIEKLIGNLEQDFRKGFESLKLKEFTEETFEKKDLESLLVYCNLCAQESIYRSSPDWQSYQDTTSEVKEALESTKQNKESYFQLSQKLLDEYRKLTSFFFKTDAIKTEQKYRDTLNVYDYGSASWQRYQTKAESLADYIEKPVFLYLKYLGSSENAVIYANRFFDEKAEEVKNAREQLIPQEQINKLSALCNTYHHTTAMEGVDAKLKKLLERVDQGYQVLRNDSAVKEEVEAAILNIETAAENLRLAEIYLIQEQANQNQNDVQTIRLIVIFTVVSTLLSFVFAMILCYRQYGRLI